MPITIVRTDREIKCPRIDSLLIASGAELVLTPADISENALADLVRDAELVLTCYTPITSRVIGATRKLKGIIKYGVGIDSIDIEAAKARHIPVTNVPEYAEETVAEGAFALLLALAKKLIPLHIAMQEHEWVWPTPQWIGNDIAGKTVGLIGLGKIGRSMARMAGAGFRATVLGYDPYQSAQVMRRAGVEKYQDLHEMLTRCDVVSVHCVLNGETRHLIGKAEFQCMKPTAILINTARGAVVDEQAMLSALRNNQIAGAGLDVYSLEPLRKSGHPLSELYSLKNVILMPHLAFYSQESMNRLQEEAIKRCFEALEGRPVLVKSSDPRLRSQEYGVCYPAGHGQMDISGNM